MHNNEKCIAGNKAVDVKAIVAELERRMAVFLSEQMVERSRTWLRPFAWLGEEVDLLTFLNGPEGAEDDTWRHDDGEWLRLISRWIETVAEKNNYIVTPRSTEKDAEKFLCLKMLTKPEKDKLIGGFKARYNPGEIKEIVKDYLANKDGHELLKLIIQKKNKNKDKKILDDDERKKIDEFVKEHLSDEDLLNKLNKNQCEPVLRYLVFKTLTKDLGLGLSENYFFKRRPTPNIKKLAESLPSKLTVMVKELFKDYDPLIT